MACILKEAWPDDERRRWMDLYIECQTLLNAGRTHPLPVRTIDVIATDLLGRLRLQLRRDVAASCVLQWIPRCKGTGYPNWGARRPSTIRPLNSDTETNQCAKDMTAFVPRVLSVLIMQYASPTPHDWMRQRVREWTRCTTASYHARIKSYRARPPAPSRLAYGHLEVGRSPHTETISSVGGSTQAGTRIRVW